MGREAHANLGARHGGGERRTQNGRLGTSGVPSPRFCMRYREKPQVAIPSLCRRRQFVRAWAADRADAAKTRAHFSLAVPKRAICARQPASTQPRLRAPYDLPRAARPSALSTSRRRDPSGTSGSITRRRLRSPTARSGSMGAGGSGADCGGGGVAAMTTRRS